MSAPSSSSQAAPMSSRSNRPPQQPRKHKIETSEKDANERPNKQQIVQPHASHSSQDARDPSHSSQRGGRGGFRGGRGGQRPQSAHQNGGGGHRGGRHNGGRPQHQQQQQQQQQQQRVNPNESTDMEIDSTGPSSSPVASSSSSSSRDPIASKFSDPSFKTDHRFDSLGLSSQLAQSLATEFKYETMSIVQSKCIPVALTGKDIVAKAKTGTGKTLAFLIPVLERVLAHHSSLPRATAPRPVRALVISPTRELAQQIEEEAARLGKFHGIKQCCVVGGLPIGRDLKKLQKGDGLDLLIATPGRLKDLLQNHDGIVESLSQISCLVLDEADRLLDMGFKPDLDAIFALLPGTEKRQTQLFSATFPANVKELTDRTLKRDHVVVNTIGDEADQTHKHVVQESILVPLEFQYEALWEMIQQHKTSTPNYKIIVFFSTAYVAGFSSRLFNQAGCPTLELHSRLSQSKRTKTSDQFRDGNRMILFSSDVSARGLDFPNVTLVIQVGLTSAEQYVHRLGRTARAGAEGYGIIMLAPFEKKFLAQLTPELPIKPMPLESGSVLEVLSSGRRPNYSPSLRKGSFAHPILYAYSLVDGDGSSSSSSSSEDSLKTDAERAYRAMLGFYNSNLKICGWDKNQLVQVANDYSRYIGLRDIPTLEPKTVGKMGLKGVQGLRIAANPNRQGGGGGNGQGRGGQGRQGQGQGQGQGRPQSARY